MTDAIMKVFCDWCGKGIDCPEEMRNAKKYICFSCFQEHEEDFGDGFEESLYVDIPKKELEELVPEILAAKLTEEYFSRLWNEKKEQFKQTNRKELSKMMFEAGAAGMLQMMKEINEDEEEERETNPEK